MIRRILSLFCHRPIVRIGRSVPGRDLTPEQIQQALARPSDDPLWQAIHQLIDDQRATFIDALTDAKNAGNAGNKDFIAGSYASLDSLQTWLITEREKVMKRE